MAIDLSRLDARSIGAALKLWWDDWDTFNALMTKAKYDDARDYMFLYRGWLVPSKQIIGLALGIIHERGTSEEPMPVASEEFSGGKVLFERLTKPDLSKLKIQLVRSKARRDAFADTLDRGYTSLAQGQPEWTPLKGLLDSAQLKNPTALDTAIDGDHPAVFLSLPGVYVVAVAPSPPANNELTPESAVYVGEARDQTLRQRLRQFVKSSLDEKSGHSGGVRYREIRNRRVEGARLPRGNASNPFVRVIPVRRANHEHHEYISLIERYLIWEYAREHGRPLLCNAK